MAPVGVMPAGGSLSRREPSEDACPPPVPPPAGGFVFPVLAVLPTRRVVVFDRDYPEWDLRGFVVGCFSCREADELRAFERFYDLARYGRAL